MGTEYCGSRYEESFSGRHASIREAIQEVVEDYGESAESLTVYVGMVRDPADYCRSIGLIGRAIEHGIDYLNENHLSEVSTEDDACIQLNKVRYKELGDLVLEKLIEFKAFKCYGVEAVRRFVVQVDEEGAWSLLEGSLEIDDRTAETSP